MRGTISFPFFVFLNRFMRQNKQSNIFLVGLMGAGKSTVGRALAARLGKTFLDQDAEIEKEQNRAIADIFACKGEVFFRDVEEAYLATFAERKNCVLATGGGVVLRENNRQRMRASGIVIYLDVPINVLVARLSKSFAHRPLLYDGSDIQGRIELLYSARSKLYKEAAHMVDTGRDHETLDETVTRIIENLNQLNEKYEHRK